MNFIIDTGNTLTKLALFQGKEMVAFTSFTGVDTQIIVKFCEANANIRNVIISSVRDYPPEMESFLSERYRTIVFNEMTPVPVNNRYETPQTLGKDRLAGAIGARQLIPATDILVIDAGTAITYDLVTAEGNYLGGGISPGISMRYKALHTFTGRLPLLDIADFAPLIAANTVSSIHSGVLNGVLAEVDGIIRNYQQMYPGLKIILSGGDYNYFDKQLKIKTFAAPNLVLEGLNLILNLNIETN